MLQWLTGYISVKIVLTGLGTDPLQQGLMSHCIVWDGHLMAREGHKLKMKYPTSPKSRGLEKTEEHLDVQITVWLIHRFKLLFFHTLRLKPSEACGPFRGLSAMYTAVTEWVQTLESYTSWRWVAWIYNNLIKSELFFFILCTFVL